LKFSSIHYKIYDLLVFWVNRNIMICSCHDRTYVIRYIKLLLHFISCGK
jgi:hypothetical protein